MKKIISALTATTMVATTLVSTSASALSIPLSNQYSLTTSTVEDNIVVEGITIPAGSLSVTINISNNTGFSASTLEIAIGDAYEAIVDERGMLVIENGSVLNDTHVSGAVGEEYVFVATASAEDNTADGDVLTFFVSDNGGTDETLSVISTDLCDIESVTTSAIRPMGSSQGFYKIGDVNDDDRINSIDASFTLSALSLAGRERLPHSEASILPTYYFPQIYDINAAYIWEGKPDITRANTAEIMLDYYSCSSTGQPYIYEEGTIQDTSYNYSNSNLLIGYVRISSNSTY
ncbi:MAG: hypothetical protein IJB68_01960 [Ruminococcus sp.]|nr:hypothetical protein [Ruminococcus sp.]